jgi:hypothetical protein
MAADWLQTIYVADGEEHDDEEARGKLSGDKISGDKPLHAEGRP